MTFRVEVDRDRCIGCLACTRYENFICGNDFKARVVRPYVGDVGCNQQAVEICPVNAIFISSTCCDPETAK